MSIFILDPIVLLIISIKDDDQYILFIAKYSPELNNYYIIYLLITKPSKGLFRSARISREYSSLSMCPCRTRIPDAGNPSTARHGKAFPGAPFPI